MGALKEIYLTDWQDFIDIFNTYDAASHKYIFRGHSNSIHENNKFIEWSLVSSFNRVQKKNSYSFYNLLTQQFQSDLFKIHYSDYKFKAAKELSKVSLLEKCYFFQHYGIPTCFIDFTFDPLIALYFSLSNIDGRSGGQYDVATGSPLFYSNDTTRDYVTIYEIDHQELARQLGIKQIKSENFTGFSIDDFIVAPTNQNRFSAFLALDLDPLSNCSKIILNHNLKKQESCFIFYDNEDVRMSLEDFIDFYFTVENKKVEYPLIKKYNINYNSLFKKRGSQNREHESVFTYLKRVNRTGRDLFDDLQGLKYDFNFFHQQ